MRPDFAHNLEVYKRLLVKWQGAVNLVGPATLDDIDTRHFADSLQLADHIPHGVTVADLGSGAGFPGLVLAMARPDLTVTLIESDQKKCTFLSTVSRETKTPVTILNQRIEDVSRETIPAIITARALAPLDKLLAYCLPWAQASPALVMLFLKGEKAAEEVAQAQRAFTFDAAMIPDSAGDGAVVKVTNLASDSTG